MRINLFGLSGESSENETSAAALINLIPTKGKDKSSGGFSFKNFPGSSIFYGQINQNSEIIALYGISTNAAEGDFISRVYFIYFDGAIPELSVNSISYASSPGSLIITKIGVLAGYSGYRDFTNIAHNKSSSGGIVIFADRNSDACWTITMDNDPALDVLAVNTIPLNWSFQVITFQDGFFIANIKDSSAGNEQRKIVSSGLNTASFLSTDFGLITSSAGNAIAINSDKREISVYCDDHIESWYNAGGDSFPFLRNQSVYIDIGLYSRDSLARFDNKSYFVGVSLSGNVGIYESDGYSATEITPRKLKTTLTSADNPASARFSMGIAIKISGERLYIINFLPSIGSWVFNADLRIWSQVNSPSSAYGAWRYSNLYTFFSTETTTEQYASYHLIIPVVEIGISPKQKVMKGQIHYLSSELFNEVDASFPDQNVSRQAISRHIYGQDNRWLFHKKITLEFVKSEATVTLYWSDDDGITWSNGASFSLSSGIFEMRQLGRSKDRLYLLFSSDSYKVSLINSWLEVSQGTF